ncbi:MAG: HNH endonuclease signature motif containing protein [Pyrinomonadaceae bacterium]
MKRIPKLHYTQINHFLSCVDQSGGTKSCWLWQGYTGQHGYGLFGINGTTYKAHRVLFFLANGRINDDLLVLHRCDVRACVNPAHLFQGTPKDNSQDAVRKGRSTKLFGEQNGKHKLSVPQVKAIRRLGRDHVMPLRTIAHHFNVSEATVSYIVHGGRWDHVK